MVPRRRAGRASRHGRHPGPPTERRRHGVETYAKTTHRRKWSRAAEACECLQLACRSYLSSSTHVLPNVCCCRLTGGGVPYVSDCCSPQRQPLHISLKRHGARLSTKGTFEDEDVWEATWTSCREDSRLFYMLVCVFYMLVCVWLNV